MTFLYINYRFDIKRKDKVKKETVGNEKEKIRMLYFQIDLII
jgi:hypothetical protein